MHRKFIALVTGAATVLTLATSPARADSEDLAKAIFGIAALAALAKAIDDHNDDRKHSAPVVHRRHVPAPHPNRHFHRGPKHAGGFYHHHRGGLYAHRHHYAPRVVQPHRPRPYVHPRPLPRDVKRHVHGKHGHIHQPHRPERRNSEDR
ncbi:MAG: hypothetical protein AAFR45_08655 [Pseudomonadota bacterium]